MDIELVAHEKPFDAYRASPEEGPVPGIVLIQEIWGLTDHIKDVANRLSRHGFAVIAPDLIGDQGVLERIDDDTRRDIYDPEKRLEAQQKLRAATAPVRAPEFAEIAIPRLQSTVNALLEDPVVNGNIGVVGFCFGGTYAFQLAIHDERIKACVPFYGQPPQKSDLGKIRCPVYAFYGEKDAPLMESLPELVEGMREMGRDFTYEVYPGVGHAFFNDTNPRAYDREVALNAWDKTLEFLHQNLDEVI